jgi:hypothetical protein
MALCHLYSPLPPLWELCPLYGPLTQAKALCPLYGPLTSPALCPLYLVCPLYPLCPLVSSPSALELYYTSPIDQLKQITGGKYRK